MTKFDHNRHVDVRLLKLAQQQITENPLFADAASNDQTNVYHTYNHSFPTNHLYTPLRQGLTVDKDHKLVNSYVQLPDRPTVHQYAGPAGVGLFGGLIARKPLTGLAYGSAFSGGAALGNYFGRQAHSFVPGANRDNFTYGGYIGGGLLGLLAMHNLLRDKHKKKTKKQ